MLVIVPTRIVPGFMFGMLFIFVGLGAGFATGTLCLEPSKLRWFPATFVFWFPLACHYVRNVWRHRDEEEDAASRITAMSPRVMAVLLGACLVLGFACGALMVYAAKQG